MKTISPCACSYQAMLSGRHHPHPKKEDGTHLPRTSVHLGCLHGVPIEFIEGPSPTEPVEGDTVDDTGADTGSW